MNRIELGSPHAAQAAIGQADARAARQETGMLLGERATVLAQAPSLAQLAQALRARLAEATERKHHAERRLRAGRPAWQPGRKDILDLLAGVDPQMEQRLLALAQGLARQGQPDLPPDPRQAASQAFGDVSQQYLALQYAWRHAHEQGAPSERLQALEDAIAELEHQSGPAILAGMNSLPAAGEFAAEPAQAAAFQRAYRDVVLGGQTLAGTLDLVLQRFGAADVARGLKHLIAALGHDLAAARPSTQPARLQALRADLYHLEVAATVLARCTSLAAKLGGGLDAAQLMRDVAGLTTDKWLTPARYNSLAARFGAVTPQRKVEFLTALLAMLRDLPAELYAGTDLRQSALAAGQQALDAAIDEEEDHG